MRLRKDHSQKMKIKATILFLDDINFGALTWGCN